MYMHIYSPTVPLHYVSSGISTTPKKKQKQAAKKKLKCKSKAKKKTSHKTNENKL